ncbi:MAG: DUF4038 domain-containing protein [Candidatus Hydrogenedentes bacterium]|nr:DUF4038 domain-containing protein [Candidatus Hydrogenedentota bacterium]
MRSNRIIYGPSTFHIAPPLLFAMALALAATADAAGAHAAPRIRVNGQCFETVRGETFFPIADTAWLLVRMSESDIAHYVQTRSAQGFNTIKFGPESEAVDFPKLDFILDTLAKYGMYAELFIPSYDYHAGALVSDNYEVGRRIAAAFRERPNIFAYTIEGLDSPHAKRDPADMRSRVIETLRGVKSADPDRLATFHPRSGQSVVDVAAIGPEYMDFYSVHKCNPGSINDLVRSEIERVPEKPVFLSEPVYEGRASMCGCNQGCTADQVFEHILGAIETGVAGISYGHHSVWSFNLGSDGKWGLDPSPDGLPWKDALHAIGAKRITDLAEDLRTRPSPCPRTVYSAETRRDASAITE